MTAWGQARGPSTQPQVDLMAILTPALVLAVHGGGNPFPLPGASYMLVILGLAIIFVLPLVGLVVARVVGRTESVSGTTKARVGTVIVVVSTVLLLLVLAGFVLISVEGAGTNRELLGLMTVITCTPLVLGIRTGLRLRREARRQVSSEPRP